MASLTSGYLKRLSMRSDVEWYRDSMMEEFVRPRNLVLDHVIRIMLVGAVLKRLL